MGDIIGRGFDKYVREQVIKRQEKLKYGQTDADVIRWNNSNNAFLRLSSGVNVSEDFVKDKLGLSSDTYKGNLLAKHFKLFAAQTYNADSGSYNFTKGVGYNFNSSYGFTSPGYTSYGLVPPPGITSANIKSLNHGSLREATVNIKCHNLQQFQIIEALYLRLKYSLLLEWGHSLYFNNKGELINSTHDLSDEFLKGGISQTEILAKIKTEREASDGNYDAFFGLVTNFDWTVNPDGGYDINMIARAAGDVIESLKINSNSPSNKDLPTPTSKTHLEVDAYKSTLNRILWSIAENVNDSTGRLYAHGKDNGKGEFRVDNSTLSSIAGYPVGYTKKGSNLLSWNEASMWKFPNLTPGWGGVARQSYIKLGTLLRIIESFLVFYNKDQSNDPIIKMDYDYENNFCFTFPRHVSIDPRVCLIPYKCDTTSKKLAAGTVFYTEKSKVITRAYFPTGTPASAAKAKNYSINQTLSAVADTPFTGAWTLDIGGGVFINISDTSVEQQLDVWGNKPGQDRSTDGTSAKIYTFTANTPYYLSELRAPDWTRVNNIVDKLVLDSSPWSSSPNLGTIDPAVFNQEYITYVQKDVTNRAFIEIRVYSDAGIKVSEEFKLLDPSKDTIPTGDGKLNGTIPSGTFVERTDLIVETITVQSRTFYNQNSSGVFTSYTGQDVYKDLEKDTGFKDLSDTTNYTGKTMEIRVNMEHIAKILSESIDEKDGSANLYTFLKKLLGGIQNSLGNVNNFEIVYNEDTNTFRVIDNTLIPGLFNTLDKEQQKIVEFLISADGDKGTNGGSFIHNINFRTKLSNAFATMATVGAQANGATVGEDATALSKWNVGLTDRIIQKRVGSGKEITEETEADKANWYIKNLLAFQTVINKTNDGTLSDDEVANAKNATTDIFKTEISSYALRKQKNPEKGITPLGFIPFDLELNMVGLSGPRIYESYTIDTRLLPKSYQDAIQFICSGISHTISNGEWKTTLNSICGPRQDGAKVEGMPQATPAKAAAPLKTSGNNTSVTTLPGNYSTSKDNNPFNLRPNSGEQFNGVIGKKEGFNNGVSIGFFVVFDNIDNGVRAGLKNLEGYFTKRKLNNIRDIVNVYAPKDDGLGNKIDNVNYINFVVKYMKNNWSSTVTQDTILTFAGKTETNANNIKMFKELNKSILDMEGKLPATLIALIDAFDVSKL